MIATLTRTSACALMALRILAAPNAAQAGDGQARILSQVVLDSTTVEWSQVFAEDGRTFVPAKAMFTNLPHGHPGRGAGYYPGLVLAIDLGELEEVRSLFPIDGDALAALIIAHEVAHHVQYLNASAGRYALPLDSSYELAADCAAGWWFGRANLRSLALSQRPLFKTPDFDLQMPRLFQALYTLKHRRLTPPSAEAARRHGTDAGRVAAFKHGLVSDKVSACGVGLGI